MDVTRHNFAAVLPVVREALQSCDFFAIDCEMTGLFLEGGNGNGGGANGRGALFLDDIEDRYEEMLASSDGFSITQFGLSAFCWEGGAYAARTFNFYTFPRPFENYDVRFVSQAASLAFLAGCDFDFNAWIKDGVPYMPLALRDAKLAALDRAALPRPDILVTKPADVAFVAELVETVTAWLAADEGADVAGDDVAGDDVAMAGGLLLPSANSYQRALQYQELRRPQFGAPAPPGFLVERAADGGGRPALRLRRATPAAAAAFEAAQRAARAEEVRAAAGFAVVLEAMRDCGKPMVGHNLSFDLSYSLRSFAGPLPPTWEEFKGEVQRWFPGGVFDTKYLAADLGGEPASGLPLLPDTALGPLYEGLRGGAAPAAPALSALLAAGGGGGLDEQLTLPLVAHAEGYERYAGAATEAFAHEAGFDAFMTGAAFAALVRLHEAALAAAGAAPPPAPGAAPALAAVAPRAWRMNLSRSDIAYAALKGADPRPDRSRVLYVSGLVPGSMRHGGDVSRRLADLRLGQVRASLVEGGAAALVEFAEREAVAPGAAALAQRLEGCVVAPYEAYAAVKAARRAGGDEEDAARAAGAKRPRVEAPATPAAGADGAAAGGGGGKMCAIM